MVLLWYGDTMRVKDIIKKETTIIAIAVVLVAVAAISVSYAVFFDVKSNEQNQVITAGTLEVNINGISKATDISTPISNDAGLKMSPITYTVKNNGNLPAKYAIYLYSKNTPDAILQKVQVSLDGTADAGKSYKLLTSLPNDTTLPEAKDGKKYYKISTDNATLAAGASGQTQYLRVWIDESLITDDIENQAIDLELYIVSEVKEEV